MYLWLVGKWSEDCQVEIEGIFSTEQKAIKACTHEHNWIGPMVLDTRFPTEQTDWPGSYYPALESISD